MIDITPDGLARNILFGQWFAAMEVAIKMAFQYWQCTSSVGIRQWAMFAVPQQPDIMEITVGWISVGGIDIFHSVFKLF